MKTKLLIIFIATIILLGVSIHKTPGPDFVNLKTLNKAISLGAQKLGAAENAWAFVRQSATWANANTDLIEAIMGPIKKSGALNSPGTYTQRSGSFIARLSVNANTTLASTAYTGTRTYKHKFELWRVDDNTKALEVFFDSTDDISGQGVLLIYNLHKCDPIRFTDNLLVETFVSVSAADKSIRMQTISWAGSFSAGSVSYSNTDRGRVVLETMASDTILCFKSVVRFANSGSAGWCPGTNNEYYSLAYGQYFASPNQATAILSLADNTIDNTVPPASNVCGGTSFQFGLFRNSGFVADGVVEASVPSDYVSTTSVKTLFSTIGTTGKGTWDDLSKTKIDGLSISFNNGANFS